MTMNFKDFCSVGKPKAKLEILLLCMGYNLNKLHAKIQNDRIREANGFL